jgi:hypothetical protein
VLLELTGLQYHWGWRYNIGFDEATGTWSARYHGSPEQLTIAASSDELRHAIRADYRPRRLAEQQMLAGLHERSST